ncbi:hypothetical protein VTK56DRAFT_5893 [Thermocarpiscus australiensis]
MDEPLETTEAFKKLSTEACQQSRDWTPVWDQVYQCKRTNAHKKLVEQFVKDYARQIHTRTKRGLVIRGPFWVKGGGAKVKGFIIVPLLEEENPLSAAEESVQQLAVILESSEGGEGTDISAKWRTHVFPSVQGDKLFVTGGEIRFMLLEAVDEETAKGISQTQAH